MAANTRQRFVGTPGLGIILSSTPVTTRTVSGATGLTVLAMGSADGKRVTSVQAQALGSTSAGMLWFWLYNSLGIGDSLIFHEEIVPAITASDSVAVWSKTIEFDNLVLPNGYQLLASTTVSNSYAFIPFTGSF